MTPAIAAAPHSPGPMLVRKQIETDNESVMAPRPKDAIGEAIGRAAGLSPRSTLDRITRGIGVTTADVILSRRPPAHGRIAVIKRACTMPEHRSMPAHPIHVSDRLSVEEV